MKNLILTALITFGFQTTYAQNAIQDHVTFGQLAFGGTGCKGEETAPVLNLKKGTLTLFTLSLQGDDSNPSSILREACSARVPVKIEKGYQLGVRVSSVSGSISQSSGVKTTVTAAASLFRKEAEQTLTQDMEKKMKGSYKISNRGARDAISWSSCSDEDSETFLALSANAFAIRNQAATKVKATVKTLKFELSVRACE